jgi:hypothetical protein
MRGLLEPYGRVHEPEEANNLCLLWWVDCREA